MELSIVLNNVKKLFIHNHSPNGGMFLILTTLETRTFIDTYLNIYQLL
jgi:hypothetical protein